MKINVSSISNLSSMSRSDGHSIQPGKAVEIIDKFRERCGLLDKFSHSIPREVMEAKVRPGVEPGKSIRINEGQSKVVRDDNIRDNVEPVVFSTSIGRVSKVFRWVGNSMYSFNRFAGGILHPQAKKINIIFRVSYDAEEAVSAKEESNRSFIIGYKKLRRHTSSNAIQKKKGKEGMHGSKNQGAGARTRRIEEDRIILRKEALKGYGNIVGSMHKLRPGGSG